jgi:hypothetical protein
MYAAVLMLRTCVGSIRQVVPIHISATFHAGFTGFLLAPYGYELKVNRLVVSPVSAFPTFDHRPNVDADQVGSNTSDGGLLTSDDPVV